MYSKLQVSCIRKLWSLVDIVSVDESAEEVRQAVQLNTNTQMLRMDYKMQNLSRFRRRLSRNILELERNGGFTVLNASYPHFSDSECDDAEANYNVMNMLQLIALVILSLESNKPELPTSYLSYTAKVNSRLHDLDVLSYNIFGQALLNTNSEFLAEDRNVSVPSEQEAIFSEFISEMFSVLIEHSIDPQLDIPMVAPQKHIIKLSESAQAKVKARMTSKKKSQEPPNIPIRESMLSLKMPDLRNSDLDLASLQSSQLSLFRLETSLTDLKNLMEDQPSAATSFSMVSPNYHSGELTRTNSVTSNMTISPKEAQKFSIRGLFKKSSRELAGLKSNSSASSLSSGATALSKNSLTGTTDLPAVNNHANYTAAKSHSNSKPSPETLKANHSSYLQRTESRKTYIRLSSPTPNYSAGSGQLWKQSNLAEAFATNTFIAIANPALSMKDPKSRRRVMPNVDIASLHGKAMEVTLQRPIHVKELECTIS